MSGFDKVVWAVVALILLPVLITPAGWAFALILAFVWLLATYGGRYALEVEKQRRQGERGMALDVRKNGRNRGGDR